MFYAGYKKASIENGIGCRTSLFVSGCTHKCKGCFNSEAWDFNYGHQMTADKEDEIIDTLKEKYIDGLTFLGGEPMEPQNQEGVLRIIKKARKKYPNKTIWLYSGYTWEQLNDPEYKRAYTKYTKDIIKNIDILVDGEFILEEKDLSLLFRGSRNQRVIDVKSSLKKGEVVLSEYNK